MNHQQEIKKFIEESSNFVRILQTSMSSLQFFYGNRDHSLQLREKFEVQAESYNNPEGYLRLFFNPSLGH